MKPTSERYAQNPPSVYVEGTSVADSRIVAANYLGGQIVVDPERLFTAKQCNALALTTLGFMAMEAAKIMNSSTDTVRISQAGAKAKLKAPTSSASDVINYCFEEGIIITTAPASLPFRQITSSRLRVWNRLTRGDSLEVAAKDLRISKNTAHSHRNMLFRQLGVVNTAAATLYRNMLDLRTLREDAFIGDHDDQGFTRLLLASPAVREARTPASPVSKNSDSGLNASADGSGGSSRLIRHAASKTPAKPSFRVAIYTEAGSIAGGRIVAADYHGGQIVIESKERLNAKRVNALVLLALGYSAMEAGKLAGCSEAALKDRFVAAKRAMGLNGGTVTAAINRGFDLGIVQTTCRAQLSAERLNPELQELWTHLARGLTTAQAAATMKLPTTKVKHARDRLHQRLGAANQAAATLLLHMLASESDTLTLDVIDDIACAERGLQRTIILRPQGE